MMDGQQKMLKLYVDKWDMTLRVYFYCKIVLLQFIFQISLFRSNLVLLCILWPRHRTNTA